MMGVLMVDVTRGERVESTHAVAACACDDRGAVVFACGDVDEPVYLRSAAKPFIAAAVVLAGAAERFGLDQREIAVMCASHAGERGHLELVASILTKIGATAEDLQCGVQAGREATPLGNNCSGKHAGILALAKVRGTPFAGYLDVAHSAQREILAFCERVFADRFTPDRIGVDGCGIPVFATSLATATRAFARFGTLQGFAGDDARALRTVRDAMLAHPWVVAGTARFDTDLMQATRGAVVAKGGAEGVHASALPASGTGLVLKVIDGAARAVPPAAIALLARLGTLDANATAQLAAYARAPVRNVAGRIVGEIRSRFTP